VSYALPPQSTKAGAPGATDDSSKGFVLGSVIVDTSVSPRVAYVCTNAAVGAATWANAGGVSSHPSLSTLGWSASGHTGTQSSVAAFNAAGAAQTVQATVEGSVLTYVGGVLQFSVVAAAIVVGVSQDKTLDVEYIPRNNTVLDYGVDAAVGPGSFI
jgi:hypothetical protein